MILVTVELLPLGYTDGRQLLASAQIGNITKKGEDGDSYEAEFFRQGGPRLGELSEIIKVNVSGHNRDEGCLKLLYELLKEIYEPDGTKD